MTGTKEEKAKALVGIEEAIANCIKVFGYAEDNESLTGWVVSASLLGFRDADDDMNETYSGVIGFVPMGQHPTMGRGIVEEHLDEMRAPVGDSE